MKITQLAKYGVVMCSASDDTFIKVDNFIANLICYMFDIDDVNLLPYHVDGKYGLVFNNKAIIFINKKLKYENIHNFTLFLDDGNIRMSNILLLMNSKKFPYKLIGITTNNNNNTFYHFLLKMNIVKEEDDIIVQ
ncbi:hypothetical protein [uncultured Methanobrevibacter sp.]|uniref:hypothetical protein n=1 Tax=uncultured Methanobrevibacter sp. TaxID=253161 RepID=UPI0025F98F79|nr:hypothetical protein [uncultured Methanobrevibacter sp.]